MAPPQNNKQALVGAMARKKILGATPAPFPGTPPQPHPAVQATTPKPGGPPAWAKAWGFRRKRGLPAATAKPPGYNGL